jgi:two-component system, LytTR family, sensor kinase
MNDTNLSIGRLFRVAVYTSILMAVISAIPLSMTIKTVSFTFYAIFLTIITINAMTIWLINISLVYYYKNYQKKKSKQTTRYLLSFVVSITFSGIFLMFVKSLNLAELYLPDEEFLMMHQKNRFAPFFSGFFTNTFILFIQELILLRENKTRIELENAQLRTENALASNQQLKQHIHPHFLFNSLSILKSLIHKDPHIAEEYVIRLSDFLRTSISANGSNVISLKDELKMCMDYIEMQKIRFGEALQVSIDIPEPWLSYGFLPGFSMQLLLENAIKHNALTPESPLHIKIECHDDWLCVANNLQKKNSLEQSTKMGLSNLVKRYKFISGNEIMITESEQTFVVKIKILDNANCNY